MKKEEVGLSWLEILIICLAILCVIFSFLAPHILMLESPMALNLKEHEGLGDTISGLMNPFIGLAGLLLTFLAFYIQYRSNIQQRDLFREEMNINKLENQFYEMLRLHKENVNEIYVVSRSNSGKVKGREVFKYFLEEIKVIYYVIKKKATISDHKQVLEHAYLIFWDGLSEMQNSDVLKGVKNDLEQINRQDYDKHYTNTVERYSDYSPSWYPYTQMFSGYSTQLAHYYRHLFQTVKFIVKQEDLSYEEKRNYLRILRSQLTNEEQALLFYNWMAGFGSNWENEGNKFFTDYRMIHNLYDSMIIEDFKLLGIFQDQDYKKEEGRSIDNLFESQDW